MHQNFQPVFVNIISYFEEIFFSDICGPFYLLSLFYDIIGLLGNPKMLDYHIY